MFWLFQTNDKEPKNTEELLSQFKELKEEFGKISLELENIKKNSQFNIQKVGIVRFNPFSEVGGDQSFSLAILDANNDGVVLTSLYTREENRVYGKPVRNGASQYLLSEEEIKAIESAKNYETSKSKNNNPSSNRRGLRPH